MEPVSEANIRKVPYTFGIWAPPADKITQQCLAAYKKGTPFACLIPSDIIRFIPVEGDDRYNKRVAEMIATSGKICFLDTGLTWLIHGAPPVRQVYMNERWSLQQQPPIREVYEGEKDRVTPKPEMEMLLEHLKNTNLTPPLPLCSSRQDWIRVQREHRISHIWRGKAKHTQDGLWFIQEKDEAPMKTIVPRTLQKPLVV